MHIADDGSVDGHAERLCEIAGGYARVAHVGMTNAERGGYGRSYNLASQEIHPSADIVLPLEDDWVLSRPLDINPLVETLVGALGIECIRMGYLGSTQRLTGNVVHTPAGPMLLLARESAEPHVFAGHPRLETVAFERRVGPWPEGLAAGATEFEVCHRPAARSGIAWPLDLGPASMNDGSLFVHIGEHGLGAVEPESA